MASNIRQQLESWLKTIDVKGSVIDVGGIHLPVKGRTKSWDVNDYKILDIHKYYKGRNADYVMDLNEYVDDELDFDVVFCLEVIYQMWNPKAAINNINNFLKMGGKLYISTHFVFPIHKGGVDNIRFTRNGIVKLLEKSGFKVDKVIPRLTCQPVLLDNLFRAEAKTGISTGEIGHLVEATKIHGLK